MKQEERVEVRASNGAEPTAPASDTVERTSSRRVYTPPTDIVESTEEYVLTMDVPGADADSLDVTYENDVLTIRASAAPREFEGWALAHSEFEFGDYQRAFEIGQRLDPERIEAGLKEGVLTIRLPKAVPSRRKVAINTH